MAVIRVEDDGLHAFGMHRALPRMVAPAIPDAVPSLPTLLGISADMVEAFETLGHLLGIARFR